jgi:microcystin-dependent protein
MQQHTHVQNAHDHALGGGQSFGVDFGGNGGGIATFGLSVGIINTNTYQGPYSATANTATNQNAGSGSSENMPPFIVLNYLIKT